MCVIQHLLSQVLLARGKGRERAGWKVVLLFQSLREEIYRSKGRKVLHDTIIFQIFDQPPGYYGYNQCC